MSNRVTDAQAAEWRALCERARAEVRGAPLAITDVFALLDEREELMRERDEECESARRFSELAQEERERAEAAEQKLDRLRNAIGAASFSDLRYAPDAAQILADALRREEG